jgi:acetyl esterase/lipase
VKHFLLLLSIAVLRAQAPSGPAPELLWPNGAPGALGTADEDKPSLTPYLAKSPNGTAVIVCPGGSYMHLAMDHEGVQVARWLNSLGISAFVLQYRLGPKYHHPAMINDAQRAIRTVRSRATALHIDPSRIGIWGFSAGGHLASTAATHFDAGNPSAPDPIDRAGSRPDFAILAYPVISFGEFAHVGSRDNLLGKNPDPKLVEDLSNDLRVTAQTPPTFLFHTTTDTTVPVENSVRFYLALRPASPRKCTSSKTDPTASAWRPPTRLFRPGADCWPTGCGNAVYCANFSGTSAREDA